MSIHLAYVALGSNLCEPVQQVKRALRALATLPKTKLERYSSLYRSAPLSSRNQPDYINAVAGLKTQLTPSQLLRHLQHIENRQGRVRILHWGSRTLDLDILLYDNIQSKNPLLTLPHPGLTKRAFVLYPLHECAPTLVLPNRQTLSDLIVKRSVVGLKKLM